MNKLASLYFRINMFILERSYVVSGIYRSYVSDYHEWYLWNVNTLSYRYIFNSLQQKFLLIFMYLLLIITNYMVQALLEKLLVIKLIKKLLF